MAITYLQTDWAGQEGRTPRHGAMASTDVLASITTAGYINDSSYTQSNQFASGDLIDASYSDGSGGITAGIFRISISATGVITLTAIST